MPLLVYMKELNVVPKRSNLNIVFLSGIGLIAFCIGFMIGVSSSPVLAVIFPSIFGLATTSIGLIQRKESKDTSIENIESQNTDFNQKQIGLLLIIFSISYFLGLFMGVGTRIGEWHQVFYKAEKKEFPWSNSKIKQPTTLANTLNWICLQEKLIEGGYKSEQIRKLYIDSQDTNFLPVSPSFYSNCFGSSSDIKKDSSEPQLKSITPRKRVPEPPVFEPLW
jgi:hypothetical protein